MYMEVFLLVSTLSGWLCVSGEGISMDLLLPYPHGGHTDSGRTHRHVRACQPIENGNLTHESALPTNTSLEVELEYFYKTFKTNGKQKGHHVVVKDPLNLISIKQPSGGGCDKPSTSTVANSAYESGCYIATNAGYFDPKEDKNPKYGQCYGNIISDSNVIKTTGVQNANFGIRRDGTVVIGYLSEDEVKNMENPFIQLVSGVGWVIRDGKNYLSESKKAECKDTQTTGNFERFFSVQSARTLLGFDDNGYVHLVTVDGKTEKRGYFII